MVAVEVRQGTLSAGNRWALDNTTTKETMEDEEEGRGRRRGGGGGSGVS